MIEKVLLYSLQIAMIVLLSFGAYVYATNAYDWYQWKRSDFVLRIESGYFYSLKKPYKKRYTLTIRNEKGLFKVESSAFKTIYKKLNTHKDLIKIRYYPSGSGSRVPVEVILGENDSIYKVHPYFSPWGAIFSAIVSLIFSMAALVWVGYFYKRHSKVR